MAAKVIQRFWSAVRGSFAGLVARDASGATEDGVALQADKADGALHVKELVTPAGGGTPLARVGSPGRLTEDYSEDLDGITGVWHPLTASVSVVRTVGAGPVAAAAVGTQVTVSGIIAGTTTIADIQTAIAADPASAELLELQGTGTDVVGAGYAGGAAEDLWAEGMIPAHVLCVLGPDGYLWPASGHAETLGPVAARVHDTDLQAAVHLTRDDVVHGSDVALPSGGGYTAVSDWIDVRGFSWFVPGVVNTGAQPVTFLGVYAAIDAAGTGSQLYFGSSCTGAPGRYIQLGGNVAGTAVSYSVPALWVRVYAASANGTTVRARLLRRRGGY